MNHAVILAGGYGTRLWPESTCENPKQFLCFENNQSLLEAAAERLNPFIPVDRIWILTAAAIKERIKKLLPEIPAEQILAEPVGRNTAPAIGWAATRIFSADKDATMFVFPSDHIITPPELFRETLQNAAEVIEKHPRSLVTLGIKPVFPATVYGYIKKGEPVSENIFTVEQFCEKPAAEKALEFLQTGQYFWNTGIFIWKAKTIKELLNRYEPEIGKQLDVIEASWGKENEPEITARCFSEMKSISIDYAVLERAETLFVAEAGFDWNDVGTWSALDKLYARQRDTNDNIAVNAELVAVDSRNCTVRGNDTGHLFALVGMQDTLVVQTDTKTLIMKKDKEELVRELTKLQ